MLSVSFVVLLSVAIILIYSTNKNQRLLKQRLPNSARIGGYVLLASGVILALQLFSGAAVVFSWLIGVMVLTALIPFTILILFRKSQ
ncbi:hypothetical protein FX995_21040 [Pseudoalteromonas flavipulchra]|uniref:DUF3325 domain-containing protein n=2 Tax=Pseudoalteromonas TaxID=53246 RepID=A0A8I2H7Z1_9GAMM|nr:hypothetical protein QT15_13370 [Pseudoalteromonas flavipulchra NCIMB 2033 = ATCC BAA-314]KJY89654.1 hypothetical protein TW75_09775 [Pseudoalteromonas piscicida]MBD0784160.1 hypothetical protein [Pseudoalteromonas flavipulchra]NLR23740.1 hypothetical protein [Pseudoalteromonas maricaloris]RZG12470.1 hypothetical protein EXT47_19325 [Pseudoalteromonas sp. CO342X]